MALYRPPNNEPAIDPLVPCTAHPLPLMVSPSNQVSLSNHSPSNHAERPATPPPPQGIGNRFQGTGPAPLSPTQRVFRTGNSQLTSPQLVLVFDHALTGRPDFLEWHLYNCLTWLVSGPFAQGLRQYGAGPGAYAGFYELAMPQGQVSTAQLADWLDTQISQASLPPSSREGGQGVGQPLYLLFPGPAMQLGDPGFQYGVDFCAYHTVTRAGAVYGVMPYPTAQGCSLWGSLSPIDALCMTASHELAEAMTDAVPGQGETGPEGEIDDFAPCLWNPVSVMVPLMVSQSNHGFTYQVQAYWSEADQRCWRPSAAAGNPPQGGWAPPSPTPQAVGNRQIGSSPPPPLLPAASDAKRSELPTASQVIDLVEQAGQELAPLVPAHRELVERFTSRKFLLTAAAIITLLTGPVLHYIPPADAAIGVTVLTAVYTIAEAVVDSQAVQPRADQRSALSPGAAGTDS